MRILVIRYDCLGDVLVATSMLKGIQEKYPGAKITFCVSSRFESVLYGNPRINNLVNSEKLGAPYDLVMTAYHEPNWNKPMNVRHCENYDLSVNTPELYLSEKEMNDLDVSSDTICVCNTCGWNSRRYLYMTDVIERLKKKGYKLLQVDNGENLGIEQLRGDVRKSAVAIAKSRLYFGVDTVFMHIAACFKKRQVLVMCVTGPEIQYIPNATILRPYPWKSIWDTQYGAGIGYSVENTIEAVEQAFVDKFNDLRFEYTDESGNFCDKR